MGKAKDTVIKAVNDYRSDLWFRAEASVHMSCGVNMTYSMYQAFIGLSSDDGWFEVLALYYILLTATRIMILYFIRNQAPDGIVELKRYRLCGIMMAFLTLLVLLVGMLVNNGNSPIKNYPQHMIFVVGVFTIYTFINSIINLVRYRKLESPLISASKSVNLAAALVSLYAFQAAMFAQFHEMVRPAVITLFNVGVAGGAAIAVAWMSGHIILRSTRALHGKEDLYIVIDDAKSSYQKEFRAGVSDWIASTGDKVPDWAREFSQYSDRYNEK